MNAGKRLPLSRVKKFSSVIGANIQIFMATSFRPSLKAWTIAKK